VVVTLITLFSVVVKKSKSALLLQPEYHTENNTINKTIQVPNIVYGKVMLIF
jgi:hypothetical protein